MFVLVLWIDSENTSVLEVNGLNPEKDEGEITRAVYKDGIEYDAKIIKKSYNKEYLNGLRVTTDGDIISQGNATTRSLGEKVAMARDKKLQKQKTRIAASSSNERILKSKSIFDSDSDRDDIENADNDRDSLDDLHDRPSTSKIRKLNSSNRINELEKQVKELTQLLRSNQAGQSTSQRSDEILTVEEDNEDPLKLCRSPGSGRVQICNSFNVWIDSAKLTYAQRWRRNPRQLTRYLITVLVGPQNLINMCARGKSKTKEAIPKDILTCVEYYVNKKCEPPMDPVDFTNVINFMISNLKNPKKN